MPASLNEVAKRAGVSLSTASRILSDGSRYSFKAETRARVLAACRELGYQPNLAARALASGKPQIVAFVVPRVYDTPFTALGSLQVLTGLEEALSNRGFHVLISSPRLAQEGVDPAFERLIQSGYLAGMIIDGHFAIEPLMQIIHQNEMPCVAVGYADHVYSLKADNFGGFQSIMRHLCELGHRQIGIVGLDETLFQIGRERLAGLRAGAAEYGIDFEDLPYVDGQFSPAASAAAIEHLLSDHPELTALVTLNDRLALNAMHVLHQRGVRIPEEISIVGYDDLPQSADVIPGLTTVNQKLQQWGDIAADMLLEIVAGGSPAAVILETELVTRASTAAPRAV